MIGRYRVKEQVGRGGMGEVYLADDTVLPREVALKRVRPDKQDSDKNLLMKEAQRASRVSDGRVATIYDVIPDGDEDILVMEYVSGDSLRDKMTGPLDMPVFWDVAVQCVEALDGAHRNGLVHRDIKPENIVVTPGGQVKILDFGIAKRLPRAEELASMTTETYQEGALSGTPPYMAPEAVLGRKVDTRADIFSLGVVFYEMLAGHRPFGGATLGELSDQILHTDPTDLHTLNTGVSAQLRTVVERMLAKETTVRYASAQDVLVDLAAARQGKMLRTQPLERPDQPDDQPFPWWARALLGIPVIALALWFVPNPVGKAIKAAIFPPVPADRSVVVLPFELHGGDKDLAALGLGITEILSHRPGRLGPGWSLRWASLEDVQDENVKNAGDARERLGANLVLHTNMRQVGTEMLADLELVDTRSHRQLDQASVGLIWTDSFALIDDLIGRISGMLQVPAEDLEQRTTERYGTESAMAFRSYLVGLGRLHAAPDSAGIVEAIGDFEKALNLDQEFSQAHVGLARAHLEMFRMTGQEAWLLEAEAACRKAVEHNDQLVAAHEYLGEILSEAKRPDEAIPELQLAIDLDPMADTYRKLADVFHVLGRADEEEATFIAATEALPNDYQYFWRLAYFYYEKGDLEEATSAFARMTELAPYFYRAYASLGGLLIQQGHYEEAAEMLEISLKLKPGYGAYSNLGTLHFNHRNFDKAIQAYKSAVELGTKKYIAHMNLAEAYYWSKKDERSAVESYRRAVDLALRKLEGQPDDVYALAMIADMYPKIGEPDSAWIYVDRALALEPENSWLLQYAALVRWQTGHHEEAWSWLEKAVARGFSRAWLRDSAVFDDWRADARFEKLMQTE
jgi:serine/threonine-protein kinase